MCKPHIVLKLRQVAVPVFLRKFKTYSIHFFSTTGSILTFRIISVQIFTRNFYSSGRLNFFQVYMLWKVIIFNSLFEDDASCVKRIRREKLINKELKKMNSTAVTLVLYLWKKIFCCVLIIINFYSFGFILSGFDINITANSKSFNLHKILERSIRV